MAVQFASKVQLVSL